MKKLFLLPLLWILLITLSTKVTASRDAKVRHFSATGGVNSSWRPCPYTKSKEHFGNVPGYDDGVTYYFTCSYVMGDPEWYMYMKANGNYTSDYLREHPDPRVKVFFERTIYGRDGEASTTSTSVFPKWEYRLLDAGNTSSAEPRITFTKGERY